VAELTAAPVVWIVDADQWPRAALRAELIERGYDAVGFVTLADALARLVAAAKTAPPRLLLVALDGQPVTARQLSLCTREHVPVVFTGGAVALAAPAVRRFPAAAVLPRPIAIGEICDAIARLVPLTA
jgi:hypothetical protein